MIALERVRLGTFGRESREIVLIFGVGLVGEALRRVLSRQGFATIRRFEFSWACAPAVRANETENILAWVKSSSSKMAGEAKRDSGLVVSVVWSAGRGGFSSLWPALAPELYAFEAVLRLSARFCEELPAASHSFHLVSSAGGLYEGQVNVDRASALRPCRPYGELKLEQERQLNAVSAPLLRRIYRPSSIYGFTSANSRLGLIATLVDNSMCMRVTTVFGEAFTLRDYVAVGDVATFLASRITDGCDTNDEVHILASGKPTSINGALVLLQRILDRTVLVVFRANSENSAPNTFSQRGLPDNFRPMDLEAGMRILLFTMQARSKPRTI